MVFKKSLLNELMCIVLPDFMNKLALITSQKQENGLFDDVIALKGREDVDKVYKLFILYTRKKFMIHVFR
jgi:hypothetical protein